MSPSTRTQIAAMTDWELICAAMSTSGNLAREFSATVIYTAYALCDGFGRMSIPELLQVNGGWDWSHVRDSSPMALNSAAAYLRLHTL